MNPEGTIFAVSYALNHSCSKAAVTIKRNDLKSLAQCWHLMSVQ